MGDSGEEMGRQWGIVGKGCGGKSGGWWGRNGETVGDSGERVGEKVGDSEERERVVYKGRESGRESGG